MSHGLSSSCGKVHVSRVVVHRLSVFCGCFGKQQKLINSIEPVQATVPTAHPKRTAKQQLARVPSKTPLLVPCDALPFLVKRGNVFFIFFSSAVGDGSALNRR